MNEKRENIKKRLIGEKKMIEDWRMKEGDDIKIDRNLKRD